MASHLPHEGDAVSTHSNDEGYVVVENPSVPREDDKPDESFAQLGLDPPPNPLDKPNRKIRELLSSYSHHRNVSEHRENLRARAPSTCNWVREAKEYLSWIQSERGGLLWITAPPGSGNSVLSSSLIQQFQEIQDTSVCYFYCRQSETTLQTAKPLPIDWISQIYETRRHPQVAEYLEEKAAIPNYHRAYDSEICWDMFNEVITRAGKVICVVDAIDELKIEDFETTDRTDINDLEILSRLVELAKHGSGNVKVLVTGQPSEKTEEILNDPVMTRLNVSEVQLGRDVEIYVNHRLGKQENVILDQETRTEISQSVASKSVGSFRYAKLALDDLLSSEHHGFPEKLKSRLCTLPQGLYRLYSTFLEENRLRAGMSKGDLRFILQWIAYSNGPLNLQCLGDVLNVSYGRPDWELFRPQAIGKIRTMCGVLIDIIKDNEILSISQHSFLDFLRNEHGPTAAHKAISLTCIEYLSFDCFTEPWDHYDKDIGGLQGCCVMPNKRGSIYRKRSEQYPLLEYASENWARHVAAIDHDDTELFGVLDNFLNFKASTFSAWNKYYWFMERSRYPERWSALHVAAHFGLANYTRHLLKNGAYIDQTDGDGISPLEEAAMTKHTGVAIQLIEAGAVPEGSIPEMPAGKVSKTKMRPLHYAAVQGNVELVRQLLLHGANPDPKYREPNVQWTRGEDRTPLHYSCQNHHTEVARNILEYLELTNMPVLHWAAENGSHEIVEVLIEAGCSIDTENADGMTPLGLACQVGSVATIKSLLRLGADPNKTGSKQKYRHRSIKGLSPLHIYCGRSRHGRGGKESKAEAEMTISALLDAGAELEARDDDGQTALFHAVRDYGRFDTASYLVHGRNASITAQKTDGMQPIHAVGTQQALNLLIDAGADIEARDGKGQTPLMTTAGTQMWKEVYAELLKRGANVHARDNEGTPLLILAARCQKYMNCERVKLLIEHGADANHADSKGRTLLHAFFTANDREDTQIALADILIANGCDVQALDYSGRTAIYTWANMSSIRMIKKLLKAGATVSLNDRQGMTPLHAAIGTDTLQGRGLMKKDRAMAVQVLLEAGADIHDIDHLGNNALSTLIRSSDYSKDILDILITAEAKPQSNFKGQTLLHLACTKFDRSYALKDVLASFPQLSINAVDHDGRTPFHVASANSQYHVQVLLQAGCDPLVQDSQGRTALHTACRARNSDVVDILARVFSMHGHVNLPDNYGRRALHDAARSGLVQSVNALLDHGADFQVKDCRNRNALHAAAEFGDEQKIWDVVDSSRRLSEEQDIAGVDLQDPIRWTLERSTRSYSYNNSMDAARQTSNKVECARIYDVVNLLLERGVIYQDADDTELAPSDLAALIGTPELIIAVFEREGNSERKCDIGRWIQDRIEKTIDINVAVAFHRVLASFKAPHDESLYASSRASLNEALFYAVQHSQERLAYSLLDRGASLIALDSEGVVTPLHLAAAQGWGSIILKASKSEKFDVEARDEEGRTALHTACLSEFNNSRMVRLLVTELGADVNARVIPKSAPTRFDSYSEPAFREATPFLMLSRCNSFWMPEALKLLAGLGADINACDASEDTALHYAIMGGFWKEQGLKTLLGLGVNVNTQGLLKRAVRDVEILKLLFTHGFVPDGQDKSSIFAAVDSFHTEAVRVLLEHGLSPKGHDEEGNPILTHLLQSAIYGENPTDINEIISLLISYGADPNEPSVVIDDEKDSCAGSQEEAAEPKRLIHQPELIRRNVKRLIEGGMEIEVLDSKGRSGLMIACSPFQYGKVYPGDNPNKWQPSKNLLAVELIKAGASVFATDKEGKSAIHCLFDKQDGRGDKGLMKILKALLDAGASPTNQSNDGSIPLFQALSVHNLPAFELMIASGASIATRDRCGNTVAYPMMKFLLNRWHFSHRGEDPLLDGVKKYLTENISSGGKVVNVNAKNASGNTPISQLLLNAIIPETDELEFLKSLGVDLFCTNDKGQSLLHCLVQGEMDREKPNEGYGSMIPALRTIARPFERLMDEGLDESSMDAEGKSALQLAERDKIIYHNLKWTIKRKRNPPVEEDVRW